MSSYHSIRQPETPGLRKRVLLASLLGLALLITVSAIGAYALLPMLKGNAGKLANDLGNISPADAQTCLTNFNSTGPAPLYSTLQGTIQWYQFHDNGSQVGTIFSALFYCTGTDSNNSSVNAVFATFLYVNDQGHWDTDNVQDRYGQCFIVSGGKTGANNNPSASDPAFANADCDGTFAKTFPSSSSLFPDGMDNKHYKDLNSISISPDISLSGNSLIPDFTTTDTPDPAWLTDGNQAHLHELQMMMESAWFTTQPVQATPGSTWKLCWHDYSDQQDSGNGNLSHSHFLQGNENWCDPGQADPAGNTYQTTDGGITVNSASTTSTQASPTTQDCHNNIINVTNFGTGNAPSDPNTPYSYQIGNTWTEKFPSGTISGMLFYCPQENSVFAAFEFTKAPDSSSSSRSGSCFLFGEYGAISQGKNIPGTYNKTAPYVFGTCSGGNTGSQITSFATLSASDGMRQQTKLAETYSGDSWALCWADDPSQSDTNSATGPDLQTYGGIALTHYECSSSIPTPS